MSDKLTPKERLFVAAYIGNGNNALAAMRAAGAKGTDGSLATMGSRMLKKVHVAAAIADASKSAAEKLGLTAEKVLAELMLIGFSDLTDIFAEDGTLLHPSKMDKNKRRVLKKIEQEELFEGADGERFSTGRTLKIELHSKEKALELLGKHLKLFTDKHEIDLGSKTLEQLIAASFEGE